MTYRTPALVLVGTAQNLVLDTSNNPCFPHADDQGGTLSRDFPLW